MYIYGEREREILSVRVREHARSVRIKEDVRGSAQPRSATRPPFVKPFHKFFREGFCKGFHYDSRKYLCNIDMYIHCLYLFISIRKCYISKHINNKIML